MMERLLTFADVRATLGLASDRQVRRLMSAADPLPVIYLNRKQPRLHPDDFAAWVTRLRLTGHVSGPYISSHDRHGAAAAAKGYGVFPAQTRSSDWRPLEHPSQVGAGGASNSRGGRPLDSLRLRRRASTGPK
jgi:hypothetical protein